MYAIIMKMPKISSATEFRNSIYETLHEVASGDPQVITHKRGEPVVLISQDKFNAMIEEREVLKQISRGVAELDAGMGIPHSEVERRQQEKFKSWHK